MLSISVYAAAQERVLQYTIKRDDNPVGLMTVKELKSGNRITFKLQSAVKTSLLFTIQVKALEEAVYENGVLMYSRFYQKVNSNERVNTHIQANGAAYKVTNKQETEVLKQYPITYNMVCLYTMEPLHVRNVFMDKNQKFAPIEKTGPHQYKIMFPDGGFNEYWYQNGTCTRIKMNSTWFSIEMELKN
jgi:hypothetical protein